MFSTAPVSVNQAGSDRPAGTAPTPEAVIAKGDNTSRRRVYFLNRRPASEYLFILYTVVSFTGDNHYR